MCVCVCACSNYIYMHVHNSAQRKHVLTCKVLSSKQHCYRSSVLMHLVKYTKVKLSARFCVYAVCDRCKLTGSYSSVNYNLMNHD